MRSSSISLTSTHSTLTNCFRFVQQRIPSRLPHLLPPPLMFLHAEGGAGKSFIARFLQCAADSYGFGHLSTAVMGVACNNLGNAVTVDSILRPRHPHVKKKMTRKKIKGIPIRTCRVWASFLLHWSPRCGSRLKEKRFSSLMSFQS